MVADKSNQRELNGLAGEFAVASELCRRGLYAQLTLGDHKKTDLLVETSRGFLRVSVKTKKNGGTWRNVKGIWQRGDRIVFVDFSGKDDNARPDFYILGVNEWKNVIAKVRQKWKRKGYPPTHDAATNTVSWANWKGCSISIEYVKAYKDRWPKIPT